MKNSIKIGAIGLVALLAVGGAALYLQNSSTLQGSLRTQPLDTVEETEREIVEPGTDSVDTTGYVYVEEDKTTIERDESTIVSINEEPTNDSTSLFNPELKDLLNTEPSEEDPCAWFQDVPTTHPYYDAVQFGVQQGYFSAPGGRNCMFYIDNEVSRAETSKFVVGAFNLPFTVNPSQTFADIQQSDWFYNYVMAVSELNIMSSYADGFFYPSKLINRAEMMAILYRVKTVGLVMNTPTPSEISPSTCPNVPNFKNTWHAIYFHYMKTNGYMAHNELCRPGDFATRGEMAEMLYQLTK